MESLHDVLPIIIYLLLIVLIVVVIILGIKMIMTVNKVDGLVEDVNKKVKSLDSLFNIIDYATDRISGVTDTIINFITSKFKGLFGRKNKKIFKEDDYE